MLRIVKPRVLRLHIKL